ncbi:MAG: hypothetical protein A2Z04_07730 [Chloroflexi bacterium RBG_16_57_9]|nr:MAG: hypothetical protein A2Z04_07730 [Chloroflexi bacterium RBG_16_57_9]
MTTSVLKRQLIKDETGNPVGAILPLEEFALVKEILEQYFPTSSEVDKLHQIEQAANDPLFLADLHDTMSAFAEVDA